MRLAFIIIYVFFISATGQSAQSAISDDILYDDINSLHGWDSPEIANNDYRNPQQTAIDSPSVTAKGFLFDDWFFNQRQEIVLLTYDFGETKQLDYFNNKWAKQADTDYRAMYTKAEISIFDSRRDSELATNPNPGNHYYEKVVTWIKDTYQAWVAKDRYGSARLVLLSFGLVGLIGIRRKFKKNR